MVLLAIGGLFMLNLESINLWLWRRPRSKKPPHPSNPPLSFYLLWTSEWTPNSGAGNISRVLWRDLCWRQARFSVESHCKSAWENLWMKEGDNESSKPKTPRNKTQAVYNRGVWPSTNSCATLRRKLLKLDSTPAEQLLFFAWHYSCLAKISMMTDWYQSYWDGDEAERAKKEEVEISQSLKS